MDGAVEMALPRITIVTPSLNQGAYIGATIRSVLAQEYPNLQYILMDGGSTDATLEVLEMYRGQLRWISEKDNGQADAINQGFSRGDGEILGWVNSDDTLAPGALNTIGQFFADHPEIGVVYGNADFIDATGKFIAPCAHIEPFNAFRLLHYADFIVQPAAFFRRSAFESVGRLDPSLHWAMDYDLWLKLSKVTRFEYLPKTLANYRWLDNSKTGGGGAARLAEVKRVTEKHGASGLPAYFRLEAVRLDVFKAVEFIEAGKMIAAMKSISTAAAKVLSSPRAVRSLLSAKTWRIIRTGKLLRNQSGRAQLPIKTSTEFTEDTEDTE
jgi:glycosyltransferase involved in cell wall biosynthesis